MFCIYILFLKSFYIFTNLTNLNGKTDNINLGFGAIINTQRVIPTKTSSAITNYAEKEWDFANSFNLQSGYYTVPINGVYRFEMMARTDVRPNVMFSVGFYVMKNNSFHLLQSAYLTKSLRYSMTCAVEFVLSRGASICAIVTASDNLDTTLHNARFTGELIRAI